jgi:hypothetical protein
MGDAGAPHSFHHRGSHQRERPCSNGFRSVSTGSVDQKYLTTGARLANGVTVYTDRTSNEVATQSISGIGAASERCSSQTFLTSNSRGACYSRQPTSAEFVLTGVVDGAGCTADSWSNRPDE